MERFKIRGISWEGFLEKVVLEQRFFLTAIPTKFKAASRFTVHFHAPRRASFNAVEIKRRSSNGRLNFPRLSQTQGVGQEGPGLVTTSSVGRVVSADQGPRGDKCTERHTIPGCLLRSSQSRGDQQQRS